LICAAPLKFNPMPRLSKSAPALTGVKLSKNATAIVASVGVLLNVLGLTAALKIKSTLRSAHVFRAMSLAVVFLSNLLRPTLMQALTRLDKAASCSACGSVRYVMPWRIVWRIVRASYWVARMVPPLTLAWRRRLYKFPTGADRGIHR